MKPSQRQQAIDGRLSTVALLLYARGKVTGDELADKLGVTLRTIYRDITRLQELGVPIVSIAGSKGGFAFDYQAIGSGGFTTDRALWNLLKSTGLVADSGLASRDTDIADGGETSLDEDDYRALHEARNRILVDHREWYTAEHEPPHFEQIRQAVFDSRRLSIIYTERAESQLTRAVLDPYGLIWKGGVWYVFGAIPSTGRFMRIRLQRIIELSETGTTFARDPDFDLQVAWEKELEDFGSGSTRVIMRIGMAAIPEFENFNWKADNKIDKHEDHWLIEMMVDRYEWLIPLVLSYAGDITIIEPPELRNTITRAATRIIDAHRSAELQDDSDPATRIGDIRSRATTRHYGNRS